MSTTLSSIEASGASVIEHGAAWLLGMTAIAGKDIQSIEASSPWIADAATEAVTLANSHGIPVVAVETLGADILALAKQIDATAPPTSAPAAGSPADPAVNPPPAVPATAPATP